MAKEGVRPLVSLLGSCRRLCLLDFPSGLLAMQLFCPSLLAVTSNMHWAEMENSRLVPIVFTMSGSASKQRTEWLNTSQRCLEHGFNGIDFIRLEMFLLQLSLVWLRWPDKSPRGGWDAMVYFSWWNQLFNKTVWKSLKAVRRVRAPGIIMEDRDSYVQLAFEEPKVHMTCLWVSSLLEGERWRCRPRASNPQRVKDGRNYCAFP